MIAYKHTSPSNKSYIGCTSGTLEKRFAGHCRFKVARTKFQKAIHKYGREQFISEILVSNIKTKEKMSLSKRGENAYFYGKTPPEHSIKMSGSNNSMFNKTHPNKGKKIPRKSKNLSKIKAGIANIKWSIKKLYINIFNKSNELMFSCFGNFKQVCKLNNLPCSELVKTYRNNSACYFNINNRTKSMIQNNGNIIYTGWHARKASGVKE